MLVVKSIIDILCVGYYLRGRAGHFDASRLYMEHVVNARIGVFVVSTRLGGGHLICKIYGGPFLKR